MKNKLIVLGMSLRESFVANVRFYRKKSGLSQQELAEKCGIATNYLSEIERGQKFPSIEIIEKLSGSLDVPAYLFFVEGSAALDEDLILKKRNKEFSERLLADINKLLRDYGFVE